MKLKENILHGIDGVLFSYSQVFFARSRPFAFFLLVVTFFDPLMGLSGLLSVLLANLLAWIFGFNKEAISTGDYGFNSLLVGLGLGFYYAPNIQFVLLIFIGALLSFLFTVVVSGVLYKYNLPFLSIPFLLALWALMLSSRNFTNLVISERGVYILNELYATGSNYLVRLYQFFKEDNLPEMVRIYFNSLGAILFQFNILSGILIAIGLFIYSRIALLFSFISFASAYYFYTLLGADITTLSYYYIGFNFILSGIALGGYFLIPSSSSALWVILLVPVIMILTSSLGSLFTGLQLGIYSLPFNIVVITFLYTLKLRQSPSEPKEVLIQHYTPEHNLYYNLSNASRFRHFRHIAISLPVFGEWRISQAHDGEFTHRGAWVHAWDFIVLDDYGKQFKDEGKIASDYYCYNKPVLAAADGQVVQVCDEVEDNAIGDSNLTQNWGNSIVINHGYQLYSQVSHLKKGSIKVKTGDQVKKGDVIALCGNSGRSPEPHLHFQLQSTPFIGSKTISYPLSHYLKKVPDGTSHEFFNFPRKGDVIKSIEANAMLYYAFHFLPGQTFRFEVSDGQKKWAESWEAKTDYYNNSYLECQQTGARAFFKNDGVLFYFTQFLGSKTSLLYLFFLGAYRVLLSPESTLHLNDEIPLHLYIKAKSRIIHDFIAPFISYNKVLFSLRYQPSGFGIGAEQIVFQSDVKVTGLSLIKKDISCTFTINNFRVKTMEIKLDTSFLKVSCLG